MTDTCKANENNFLNAQLKGFPSRLYNGLGLKDYSVNHHSPLLPVTETSEVRPQAGKDWTIFLFHDSAHE